MDVIYKSCCGIDVHKDKLVAYLKIKGKKNVIKEFSEQTEDIRLMAKWLLDNKCEKVAMESTASFWKPLVNIFDITNLDYTVFYAQYQRISMRRRKKRALLAVAHSMLIAIYYMKKEDKEFEDLDSDFYNKFNKEKKANAYMKKLKELGYNVQLVA